MKLGRRIEETTTYSVTNGRLRLPSVHTAGIFGLEYFHSKTGNQLNFFAHHLAKAKAGLTPTRPVLIAAHTKADCYDVMFKVSPFMPFRFKVPDNFWHTVDKYTKRHLENGALYIQLIFEYIADESWKQTAHAQYNAYLDGIESPSANERLRSVQYKLANMFSGLVKKQYPIAEVIEKIEQSGFYVWARVLLQGDEKTRKRLYDGVKLAFGTTEYANGWHFKKTNNTALFIEQMQTRLVNRQLRQILSPAEMTVFFGGTAAVEETPTETVELVDAIPEPVAKPLPVEMKAYEQITEEDQRFAEDLAVAFSRLHLLDSGDKVEIVAVKEGPTLKIMTFMRPEKLYLTKVQSRLPDLEVELLVEGISIERGDTKGSLSIIIPKPLENRTVISLESLLNSDKFKAFAETAELPFIMGVDILGVAMFEDVAKLVHTLIAGQTGGGKSVFLSCLLTTLTITLNPEQLHLYLIDPKLVELSPFKNLPHVKSYTSDLRNVLPMLGKIIGIMEERYSEFDSVGVKNITQYNKQFPDKKLPFVVLVVEEYGDLALQIKKLEEPIERLGQKARAAGIHMVLTTQRPEADIVTGLIKANMPTKISFALGDHNDYRTVFGKMIPFRLLGKGDGCFSSQTNTIPFIRFQSPFDQDEQMFQQALEKWAHVKQELEEFEETDDDMFNEAVKVVAETREATASMLQRRLKIGYSQAAELLDEMEEDGLVGPFEGAGSRKILFTLKEGEPVRIDGKKEQLKRIICDTGETRVTELRKHTKMQQNKLGEYMKELVAEGWIEAPVSRQSGYKLLLTEEQREAYLNDSQDQ